jgi:small subunit ribosomal protein S17
MRKQRKGKVISDKMQSTVIVETINLVSHPLYKKTLKRRSKFVAHNPDNKAKLGDMVTIIETKPLSKTKRWMVVEISETTKSEHLPISHKGASKSKKSTKKGAR